MKVLDYTYPDLYNIQVQTQDIVKSWEKFRVRVTRPEEYCKYLASSKGTLSVYNCEKKCLEEVTSCNWSYARPVFFESCEYTFAISFTNIKAGTKPCLVHENADVERLFNVIETKDTYILAGNINFLNQPGRFSLRFTFTSNDGKQYDEKLEFDVVSPKLDTKGDLNQIIKELKSEYNDLVFRYLTLTYQQFSLGSEANNDLIWLSVFKQVIEDYLISVRYILYSPHNRQVAKVEHLRADKIKRWSNPLAEKFSEDRVQNEDKALRKYYRNEIIDSTSNTLENRFVKYTIERISERLGKILKQIKYREDTSKNELDRLAEITLSLDSLRHNSFFRGIGRFEGFKQESMVLQQRSGYSQVYRYWILLQRGLDLIDGDTSVGVQPVWKLYELWCFLKVKRMVADVLGIDLRNRDHLQYVHEDTTNTANPFAGGDLTGTVKYNNPKNGDIIEVGYQYSFKHFEDKDGFRSMTVEQKPDIVMHIHKTNNISLTYLFDAKYRVQGDDDPSIKDPKDYPLEDTLNQMHRYRDAIYYSAPSQMNFSKEIVGGYILFPGRLDERKCQSILESGDYNNKDLPYYLRSIEDINIGAFPLLPSNDSGILLKKFLERIIIIEDVRAQIEDSVPQRGLRYSLENNYSSILIASYKDLEQRDWILHNRKYSLPLDDRKAAIKHIDEYKSAQYLLLYMADNTDERFLYKLSGETELITREELLINNYPNPKSHLYMLLNIEYVVEKEFGEHVFELSSDYINLGDNSPQLIQYINLFKPEIV